MTQAQTTPATLANGPNPRRVLLVSTDTALPEAIEDALHASGANGVSLTRQDDVIHALGYLGTMNADDRPQVVISRMAELDEPPQAAAKAMRELAPQARLVLLATADQEPQAAGAIAAGFDAYLLEPLDSQALRRAVQGPTAPPDAAPGTENRPGERLLTPDELLGQAPRAPHLPAGHAGQGLGDVDLINQLLSGGEPLRPLALRMLADHAKIEHLGCADDAELVPPGHAAVAITLGEQTFGLLHAPAPASAANLEPWAGWLGHWLALEQRLGQLWKLAVRDELTGVYNRRYLYRYLNMLLERAGRERFRVTVLVFDIDDFKQYNDRYGHAAGDEILREAARLMVSVVREHDVVARIGGDEFAVVFWDAEGPRRPHSEHPDTIRKAAGRFQQAICQHKFPKLLEDAPGTLTISGGMAGFPWDGRSADELLQRADEMALHSKRHGKNVITFGPGAQRTCEILRPDSDNTY